MTGSDYPVLLAYESYAKTFSYIREAGLDDTAVEQSAPQHPRAVWRIGDCGEDLSLSQRAAKKDLSGAGRTSCRRRAVS
jgi:hypothetical protein